LVCGGLDPPALQQGEEVIKEIVASTPAMATAVRTSGSV
jgi:hypothetical protein